MPIYEYRCGQCGHELEALQKLSDAPLTDCPVCQHATLQKRVSAAAFRLKGGGWYETDFKNSKQKNLATGDKPAEGSGAKADSGSKSEGASSSGAGAVSAPKADAKT